MKKKVNYLIALTILGILFSVLLTLKCSAQEYIGYGYLFAFDNNEMTVEKTMDENKVFAFIYANTGIRIDRTVFDNDFSFEVLTANYELYIEKKAVFQKKNGKLKYRKITNKRERLINHGKQS
jgi:hypothetical protein